MKAKKALLTVCRILVGCVFLFSSFTKGVDPLGTKYKMLDYFAAYHIEWLNGAAMVLAVLMILAEFLIAGGVHLLAHLPIHEINHGKMAVIIDLKASKHKGVAQSDQKLFPRLEIAFQRLEIE